MNDCENVSGVRKEKSHFQIAFSVLSENIIYSLYIKCLYVDAKDALCSKGNFYSWNDSQYFFLRYRKIYEKKGLNTTER